MEGRPSRELVVELPVGYTDDDGRIHRTATLRKMTGHEEALLTDRKLRQNAGILVTELLSSCLRGLGEVEPVTRQIVAQLTSPDRNFLLVQLRKFTFGSELEATYRCPTCGESTRTLEDLDELPVRSLNGDGTGEIMVELEDGYEDKDGTVYTTMVFRLPTGQDEAKVAASSRENVSRGTNALLTRCLVTVGDMPTARSEGIGTRLISDLTMGDRARIERAFRKTMPGVDLTREVACDSCGRMFQAAMDLTGFFSLQ